MSDHSNESDDADTPDEDQPIQGQVRHNNLSARVPESVGTGVFSNGVMILTGPFELVIDFVMRMGEQQKIVSRVVMPHVVAKQFSHAFQENIHNYEKRFGKVPELPKPIQHTAHSESLDPEISAEQPDGVHATHPENTPSPPHQPQIEEIYDDLKLPDEMLSGAYANAVLIRHSGTEFCFDFITNLYPRSAVSSRVFLAVPHANAFLGSLKRSTSPPPGTSQEFA